MAQHFKFYYSQAFILRVRHYFNESEHELWRDNIERLSEKFLSQRTICQPITTPDLESRFEFKPIPGQGYSPQAVIDELERSVLPYSINTGSPYFIGHMTALLPNFNRPLSKLQSTLNQNMVKLETANATTFYEKQALAMLHHAIYDLKPSQYSQWITADDKPMGMVTSGGTVANLMALQIARAYSLGSNVEIQGVSHALQDKTAGNSKGVSKVIVSELGHYSIKKSLAILGIGKDNLVTIPVDEQQQIRIDLLEEKLQELKDNHIHVCAIVGIAGTTECGSFDPLDEMAALAKKYGHYFHVDGAWGGALIFSQQHKALLKGIELADSVTIDGHKQLYLPIGTGILILKDPTQSAYIENRANYIIRSKSLDLGRYSVEAHARPVFYIFKRGLNYLVDMDMQKYWTETWQRRRLWQITSTKARSLNYLPSLNPIFSYIVTLSTAYNSAMDLPNRTTKFSIR
ncbi:aminotransferase class V-fold PLP-dependent enzyme [Vibrio mexicanus]|uniref:aminotransferase class V-fold PLP-dependent enzyme n=1 Tax=Vibrio mexicanus TaxID=1004326 RepID=UPI00069C2A1D|nr:aminotransferase class V-fold PLP-dependent enzyme [Vibrio mexicanus]